MFRRRLRDRRIELRSSTRTFPTGERISPSNPSEDLLRHRRSAYKSPVPDSQYVPRSPRKILAARSPHRNGWRVYESRRRGSRGIEKRAANPCSSLSLSTDEGSREKRRKRKRAREGRAKGRRGGGGVRSSGGEGCTVEGKRGMKRLSFCRVIRGLPRGICYPRERKSRDSRGFARAARLGSPIMSISNTTNCTQPNGECACVCACVSMVVCCVVCLPLPLCTRPYTLPATRRRRRLHRPIKFSGE